MQKLEINYQEIIKRFFQQRRVVGLLKFKYKEDNNISKWYSLTENLVVRAFGLKSNQLEQLQEIHNNMLSQNDDTDWQIKRKMKAKDTNEKLKNLLTVFIEELQMDSPKPHRFTKGSVKNTLIAKQSINVNITISQIIENIRETEPDEKKVKEAEIKLNELDEELRKKNPAWAKIKGILEWLLNFSRDAFLAVIPIILENYKK